MFLELNICGYYETHVVNGMCSEAQGGGRDMC